MSRFFAICVGSSLRSLSSCLALSVAFYLAGPLPSAAAAVTTQGDVNLSGTLNGSMANLVGDSAVGSLTIDGDSDLFTQTCAIGNYSTGTGTVNITDHGSTWNYSESFYVGNSGKGTLNIINGGAVNGLSNGISAIGYQSGSTGFVTVSGSGSTWTTPMSISDGAV